jgi:outer membrane protein OmpA-like peptidoglycan-associated protein
MVNETERDTQRSAALLALANRLATQEVPPPRFRFRAWWAVVAGAVVLCGLGIVIVLAMTSDKSAGTSGDEVRLIEPASTQLQPAATTPTNPGTARAATTPTTLTAPTVRSTSPVPRQGYLVYQRGSLTLHGAVSTQAMADAGLARARAALAPNQVFGRFAVDPRVGPPSDRVVIDVVYAFPRDATALPIALRPELDRLAAVLRAYPGVTLEVSGYTDSEGSSSYNLRLSTSRAQAVVDYLALQGVDRARLSVVGRGEADPLADNGTADGRARNRRIEIRDGEGSTATDEQSP